MKKPSIHLTELAPNAFELIATTQQALRKAGADKAVVDQYRDDAMSSASYSELFDVTREYATIKVPAVVEWAELVESPGDLDLDFELDD